MKGPLENQGGSSPRGDSPLMGVQLGGGVQGVSEGPGERAGSNHARPEGAKPGYDRTSSRETAPSPLSPTSV